MFASQKRAEPEIVALVELDLRKVRVRFVLARQAIRERMRELEGSEERTRCEGLPDSCRFNP
jgi:hypothetical protein